MSEPASRNGRSRLRVLKYFTDVHSWLFGIRSDLPEAKRLAMFSGHSLRAGLASSAEVDERYVQKHLGHASAEMTRRYQRRRDRFRVNLTKAAGL